MPIETLGAPTVVPPTPSGNDPQTVPTNAGVFQAEIAADSVSQQVQQIQQSEPQAEASEDQRQVDSGQQQQSQQTDQTNTQSQQTATSNNAAPNENRGENVDLEV